MKLFKINLHLFEGGAAAGSAGDGASAAAAQAPVQSGSKGEFANIKFGKQESSAATPNSDNSQAAAEIKTTSNTLDDQRKAYFDAINGDYKQFDQERIQGIIDKRFKETKQMEAKLAKQQNIMDVLAQRYGVTDPDEIEKAVNEDKSIWSQAAEEAGMTDEQFRKFRQLQIDNQKLLRDAQQRQTDAKVQAQIAKWTTEEQALLAKYPKFSLEAESQNPEFMRQLKAGTPMELAYKLIHMDEMMSDAITSTAQQTQKAVVDNVRTRGTRPNENGTASQSAFTVKDDVSKLTKAERAEIAKRVQRGERISF